MRTREWEGSGRRQQHVSRPRVGTFPRLVSKDSTEEQYGWCVVSATGGGERLSARQEGRGAQRLLERDLHLSRWSEAKGAVFLGNPADSQEEVRGKPNRPLSRFVIMMSSCFWMRSASATLLSTFQMLPALTLVTSIWGKYYGYDLTFIDEGTEIGEIK